MTDIIELKEISLKRNNFTILKNINWKIIDKENWVVFGRNGSGKSFLLKILSANIFPSSGEVRVLGKKFGEVNMWELRKSIGVVSDALLKDYDENTTVKNVIYSGFFASNGLYEEITDDMKDKETEIIDLLEIKHIVNNKFCELSYGQQKIVLIARALVFDPKLLILDEACSGLDFRATIEFLNIIDKIIKAGKNIVYVTHNVEEILPSMNKILFIEDGTILSQGNIKDLVNSKMLSKVFSMDLNVTHKHGKYFMEVGLSKKRSDSGDF